MIVDIMSTEIAAVYPAAFVVDATGATKEVPVNQALGGPGKYVNADGNGWFAAGDNVILDEVRVNIPFGFGQGTDRHNIELQWLNSIGGSFPIAELATAGELTIPDLCTPLKFENGLFLSIPKAPGGTGKLVLFPSNVSLNVSMINAPALLNGDTLKVQYHLVIRHTLPLTLNP